MRKEPWVYQRAAPRLKELMDYFWDDAWVQFVSYCSNKRAKWPRKLVLASVISFFQSLPKFDTVNESLNVNRLLIYVFHLRARGKEVSISYFFTILMTFISLHYMCTEMKLRKSNYWVKYFFLFFDELQACLFFQHTQGINNNVTKEIGNSTLIIASLSVLSIEMLSNS